jgi:soluble lytic murein transglycosylase-like protein
MSDLAEDELHMLLKADNRAELAPAVLMIARQAGLPSLSIRLAVQFQKPSDPLRDAALYPVPNWKPAGGFSLDPALLFALMRQESGFNPRAQSAAGASGLMQLMPATAKIVATDAADRQGQAVALDPVLIPRSLSYVSTLLKDHNVKGDLMLLAIAYNAGPGNLAKYRASANYEEDPLLFMESIPLLETRQFIERSPFVCVAPARPDGGLDVSPRGDPAGFGALDEPANGGRPEWHVLTTPSRSCRSTSRS